MSSTGGEYGYGRAPPAPAAAAVPGTLFEQLATIATYLRNYMADFRNPSFYTYWLDGNGFHINDGGSDMYDSGNITTPWLRSGTNYTGAGGYSASAYPSAIN